MFRYHFTLTEDGKFGSIGVDWGSSTPEFWVSYPYDLRQVRPDIEPILVVKIPGGMHWSGRGEQSYSGAYFLVLKVTEYRLDENRTAHIKGEELIEVPIRKAK